MEAVLMDINELLRSLELNEDAVHIEPIFKEHMWLSPCYGLDGKRIGITDCCHIEMPCTWHQAIAKSFPERMPNREDQLLIDWDSYEEVKP